MRGVVSCDGCERTAPADVMYFFPHKPGCEFDRPGSILRYDPNGHVDPSPWDVAWDWPRPTSSYELEMRGYQYLQNKVRFSSAGIPAVAPAQRHREGTRVHRLGRQHS